MHEIFARYKYKIASVGCFLVALVATGSIAQSYSFYEGFIKFSIILGLLLLGVYWRSKDSATK